MKRITLFMACLALAAAASCSQQQTGYTLDVALEGLPDSTLLELAPASLHIDAPALDTVTLAGGKAVFKGVLEQPMSLGVRVIGTPGQIKLVMGNEKVSVKAKAEKKTYDNGNEFMEFSDVEVTGSKVNDQYLSKVKPRRDVEAQYDSLDNGTFFNLMDSVSRKIWKDNDTSWWGPFLMLDLTSYLTASEEPQYESFPQEVKDSYYGKQVYQELYPLGRPGDKVPEFQVTGKDGKTVSFASLREGHKLTLLDFWASWCHPCRQEIPNIAKAYNLYKDKGLQVVSISIDKKEEDWVKACDEEKMQWPSFHDPAVADLYYVTAIPRIVIVDESGALVALDWRGQTLLDNLAERLK
jgi:peroxiredoxin